MCCLLLDSLDLPLLFLFSLLRSAKYLDFICFLSISASAFILLWLVSAVVLSFRLFATIHCPGDSQLVIDCTRSKYKSILCDTVGYLVLIFYSCIHIVRGFEAAPYNRRKHKPNRPGSDTDHLSVLQPNLRSRLPLVQNICRPDHIYKFIQYKRHHAFRQDSFASWLFSPTAGCAYATSQHCCFIFWFLDGQHSATGYSGIWKLVKLPDLPQCKGLWR